MTIDKELVTDYTFTLVPDEIKLIKLSGLTSLCTISTKCNGGTYIVKSTIDSDEFVKLSTTTESDITWEFIKINDVTYTSINTDIPSLVFTSPNFLYVKNTSIGTIKVSLRGNR